MTIYSLSEIQSTCKKAAKGAGLTWGLAEEVGMIAKSLTKLGLDGAGSFVPYFKWLDDPKKSMASRIGNNAGIWSSIEGDFCSLKAGTILADRAALLQSEPFQFDSVICPMVLVGQIYIVANHYNYVLKVTVDDISIMVSGSGLECADEALKKLQATKVNHIKVERVEQALTITHEVQPRGCDVSHEDWAFLNSFAAHTYAPESEESRLSGAGAGLQDND